MIGQTLITLLIGTICVTSALQVGIRADSNRDGTVDIEGSSDLAHQFGCSDNEGAIFLANIGDTDRRCSKLALAGPALSNAALDDCNDASDDVQRAPQYMAKLLTIPIPDIGADAVGSVTIANATVRSLVRIFRQEGRNWVFTSNNHTFSHDELAAGLSLGIDARDTRRPGIWDGRVEVTFTVRDGKTSASDAVRLRVAPVITHHHGQFAEHIFTTAANITSNPFQMRFVNALSAALNSTEAGYPLSKFTASDDLWAQDFWEPGYTSMPGPNGSRVVLRVHIRSAQDERVAGRQVFEYLRNSETGGVQHLGGPRADINAMGNLETIPPYEHNGKKYPAGRIIMGRHGDETPHIVPYLQAQELQEPLIINTGCLAIGHVDEMVQFLPVAGSRRGWVMMVADPLAGVKLLQDAQDAGHGDVPAFSRKNDTEGNPMDLADLPGVVRGVPTYTVSDVLNWEGIVEANKNIAKCIDDNVQLLKTETGLTDDEIQKVPVMMRTGWIFVPGYGYGSDRNMSTTLGIALYPEIVNGLVLNDEEVFAPRPWGPVIDSKDIVAEAANAVYKKVGYNITYLDNWNALHTYGGEVHCGTNSIRNIDRNWW